MTFRQCHNTVLGDGISTVIFLLGEWMIPVNQENLARSAASAADAATTAPEGERHEDAAEDKQDTVVEVKGDPEMAPVFLRHLLPIFTHVFQSAMVQSVRYIFFYVMFVIKWIDSFLFHLLFLCTYLVKTMDLLFLLTKFFLIYI